MPLVPLKIKGGVVKDTTEYASGLIGPYWTDTNLVRFVNGYPQKIGGWTKETIYGLTSGGAASTTEMTLQSPARNLLFWRAITNSEDYMAIGTSDHLYMLENGYLYDITPLRDTETGLSNPIATASSTTVTITDASHGATVGDWIVLGVSSDVGGVTAAILNQYKGYQITKVVNSGSYEITLESAATSTATGGGTTSIKYLIGNADGLGIQTSVAALGWGVGGWGGSTWGTARSTSESDIKIENSQWSLNLWGEDLIATVRGHDPYYWDTSGGTGTRAALVSAESGASATPTTIRVTSVSFPDRHLVAAGVNTLGTSVMDPMLVRWSDQEDFVDWTPTTTNTSGDQRLEVGTKIVCIFPTRNQTFIGTDEGVYGMAFVGPPFIFSFQLLATNCGVGGKNTAIDVDGTVYWMGKSNFFIFSGGVQEIACPVRHYVFDRIQNDYIDKSFVAHNKKFNEITWFYVSTSNSEETNPEPDSYVVFNYAENLWSIGSMDRTCWSDAFGPRDVPFAFDDSGVLYNQESGTNAGGSAMNSYIESAYLELSNGGDKLFLVDKLVPDTTMTSDTSLSITATSKKYPASTAVAKGPFTIINTTEKLSLRAKGRQMKFKISSSGGSDSWELGEIRINAREDGTR
jgi:hypothetical protein